MTAEVAAGAPGEVAFRAPADAPKWRRWFVYSALARIVIFAIVAAVVLWLMSLAVAALGLDAKNAAVIPRRAAFFLRQLVPFVGAYLFLVYVVERRKPTELAWRKVWRDGPIGLGLGVLFISAVVGVIWLAGSYEVTGTNPEVEWFRYLLLAGLGTAIAEEIVFRGVLFRITEEGLGTWFAVIFSALFFGGIHIMNMNATLWSSFAIAIEAGVLLGLAYHLTRSLPLVIGIHMAWNFTQGAVYGIPVSGIAIPGYLVSNRPGPEWLTGGAFGAEASVVGVLMSVVASALMLVAAIKRGSVVVRPMRRRPIMEAAPTNAGA